MVGTEDSVRAAVAREVQRASRDWRERLGDSARCRDGLDAAGAHSNVSVLAGAPPQRPGRDVRPGRAVGPRLLRQPGRPGARRSTGSRATGVVFDAAYSNSPLCTPGPLLHDDRPAALGDARLRQRGLPRQHDPDVRPLRALGGLPHRARRQDALRRARPAARLRGAAHHRHLPGRLRLDAQLAAARRAHRLVVPQHGRGHQRRRRRGHQPAAVRRRGRPPGRARAARPRPRRRRAAVDAGRLASPTRTTPTSRAGSTGTSTTRRDIPLPAARAPATSPLDPHTAAAAPRQRHGRGRDHRPTTYAVPGAPTTATSPTSTSGPPG